MTPVELFTRLADAKLPELVEAEFRRRDLCIFSTRLVMQVAEYFGVTVEPMPVRAVAYNAAFAKHVADGTCDTGKPSEWGDGSWSVGIGYGYPPGHSNANGWNGHLVAAGGGHYADFAISQAERPERDLVFGGSLIAVLPAVMAWSVELNSGCVVEYERIDDCAFLNAPDWLDPKQRRRRLAGQLIRELKR
jgi:hypothetical protein